MKESEFFAEYVSDFLMRHLLQSGFSKNTVNAYQYTLVLLVRFMEIKKGINWKKLKLKDITRDTVYEFLNWLRSENDCSDTTSNCRLAAIHSFYSYVAERNIEYLNECVKITSIRFRRNARSKMVSHLSVDGIKLLLDQPDTSVSKGRRDQILLGLLYESAGRIQETLNLTPSRLTLSESPAVGFIGKGKKNRTVFLPSSIVPRLQQYLNEANLTGPEAQLNPLFPNSQGQPLSRFTANTIIQKYFKMAKEKCPSLMPNKISCHSLRHSRATHWLEAGMPIYSIKLLLGHEFIETTMRYARVNPDSVEKAIRQIYPSINPDQSATWNIDQEFISYLKRFT